MFVFVLINLFANKQIDIFSFKLFIKLHHEFHPVFYHFTHFVPIRRQDLV